MLLAMLVLGAVVSGCGATVNTEHSQILSYYYITHATSAIMFSFVYIPTFVWFRAEGCRMFGCCCFARMLLFAVYRDEKINNDKNMKKENTNKMRNARKR